VAPRVCVLIASMPSRRWPCLDGTEILAVLDSDGLRLFDLETGKQTIPPVEMRTTAKGVAWGRVDDLEIVVTAHFATVRVWNPRTGRKITELRLGTRIDAISLRNAGDGRLWLRSAVRASY
jgi:hypothetical protein